MQCLASGKLHFVDARNGEMKKTIAFPYGAAGGAIASRDKFISYQHGQ